ncbi:HYC_CC_PP family protein [Sphingobacterium kitahiroshimense]|uniref:HYC_CC_PP family protein n=1 Tax=Sphingobacterium kitahiroshimense TaxID=470446 RepID=UPI00320A1D48
MKKLFVIFLSFVYLILSSGFAQYAHFCMGTATKEVTLTNINHNTNTPCAICASKEKGLEKKKKNCCKVETQIFKTDKASSKQAGFDFSLKIWGDVIPNRTLGAVFDKLSITNVSNNPHYLSDRIFPRTNPLYIFHCIYRI